MSSVGAEVESATPAEAPAGTLRHQAVAFVIMVAVLVVLPFFVYPIFLMKALCFALFACAFNLLIGYVGLLSFGHAAFLGAAGYVTAHAAKVGGGRRSGHRRRTATRPPWGSPSGPWPSAAGESTSPSITLAWPE